MQRGCMERNNRKEGPDAWQFRWSETSSDGKRLYDQVSTSPVYSRLVGNPAFLVCFRKGRIEEDTSIVKRERVRQVIVTVIGLLYVGLLYPLYTDLWHSKWLIEMHNEECEPMFITFFVALGFFLLLAARKPREYRTVIVFAAWQSLAQLS